MPAIPHLKRFANLIPQLQPFLKGTENRSPFTLDSSGLAGFFGGEGAVGAMAAVYLLPLRALFGWYNTPGSYEIAKHYGQLADSPFWDGLFPGSTRNTTEFFELEGKFGPSFLGVHSGQSLSFTGHLAHLLFHKLPNIEYTAVAHDASPTTTAYVTVIRLPDTNIPQDGQRIVPIAGPDVHHKRLLRFFPILALIPIAVSVAACTMCLVIADFWSFSSILFGIVANGIAHLIIGSGKLTFRRHSPVQTAAPVRPGDGILWYDDQYEIIVLLGTEEAIDVFTRGNNESSDGKTRHGANGWCSILLTIQFLAQLILIPQGTLFGQLVFIATLTTSWIYNMFVSALDREELQTGLVLCFFRNLPEDIRAAKAQGPNPTNVRRFLLPSWRTATVLCLLFLQKNAGNVSDANLGQALHNLLPNDTRVWMQWKRAVIARVTEGIQWQPGGGVLESWLSDVEKVLADWEQVQNLLLWTVPADPAAAA